VLRRSEWSVAETASFMFTVMLVRRPIVHAALRFELECLDTGTGLISALTMGAIATQGTAEFNALTAMLAMLIGLFFLLFGALRMGWVAAFIPTPVMRGSIDRNADSASSVAHAGGCAERQSSR
jgi:MFS superfamily sulfate permease-like transporter